MRTSRGYLFCTCYSKRVAHHHLGLAETQRQAEAGKLHGEKREGFRWVLPGGHHLARLEVGSLEVGHPMSVVRGAYLVFPGWS